MSQNASLRTRPSRRRFLFQLGGLSLLGAGVGRVWLGDEARLHRVERRGFALGTAVSLTALHTEKAQASRAVDAAYEALELVERLMSVYRSDSEISRLNREKCLTNPHPYVLEILRQACAFSEATRGAFDVTVQPLWQCYQDAKSRGELPRAGELAAAQARVGWERLELSEQAVTLTQADTEITLNGIAQGFAADRVADAFRTHGVTRALVDTGEISALGADEAASWRVGIQHPRRPDAFVSLADLADRCLATSGDYATTFSEDFSRNHLLDPRTGLSPAHYASVSVVAPTALEADALSTALFVLPPEEGLSLAAATPGVEVLLVDKAGAIRRSPGFPSSVA